VVYENSIEKMPQIPSVHQIRFGVFITSFLNKQQLRNKNYNFLTFSRKTNFLRASRAWAVRGRRGAREYFQRPETITLDKRVRKKPDKEISAPDNNSSPSAPTVL
jgi:hypothetical protein